LTTPTRILLIDDDVSYRARVEAALKGSNLDYTLVEAHDAQSGLNAAERESFDCVLLDCDLTGVAAPEFLARLTAPEGGRQAVIALTDGGAHEAAVTLLRAGALDSINRHEADSDNLARAIRYAKARRGFVIELQAARDDAEAKSRAFDRLNRQKTLILSIIAHDLRDPFQALLGMSRLLAEGTGPHLATAQRATTVYEAAAQAHGLLESLFAWASLHMDARAAEPARLSVAALFADCARGLQERAEAKNVRLAAAPTALCVQSQDEATAAILRNLVANALKFTAAGGRVTLAAERRGDCVALSVTDTGVGMSEAQTAALFQLENRAASAGTAGERGAGLGLLLCRDLAESIGGALEVESRLGGGTKIRLVLPAAEAA
jgi:signal transduction histidine kinase